MDIILSIMNVILGLILAHVQFKFYYNNGNKAWKWIWIKLLMGIMGLYWSGIYTIITLDRLKIIYPLDLIYFSKIFILPAFTITLGLIAAGGLMRRHHL